MDRSPRITVALGKGLWVSHLTWRHVPIAMPDSRRIPRCPSHLGRSPDVAVQTRVWKGPPRRNSRIYPRFRPQLEKNNETSPSPRDEARFPLHCMQRNSVVHIKHERSLDFLDGPPEKTQDHGLKSRGILRSLELQERAPLAPNQLEMRA